MEKKKFDQLYPMREEMARRNQKSDKIQIDSEPEISSQVGSTTYYCNSHYQSPNYQFCDLIGGGRSVRAL